MPMLVPPVDWVSSKGGGYLTDAGGLVPLVRTRNKSYLRDLKLGGDVSFESVNGTVYAFWNH